MEFSKYHIPQCTCWGLYLLYSLISTLESDCKNGEWLYLGKRKSNA